MSIPDPTSLLLPVLQVLADQKEHSIDEIRERMRIKFEVTSDEVLQKHPLGNSIFRVNVALVLANLQGAPHRGPKAIEKVQKNIYRINDLGIRVLNKGLTALTI